MSIISGRIDGDGAIVGVLVGVSANREAVLRRLGMPVPATVPLRLLIDTGSFLTGLPAEVFARLGLTAVYQAAVRTPSTRPGQPFLPDIYDVAVGLASGISVSVLPSVQVLCSPSLSHGRAGQRHPWAATYSTSAISSTAGRAGILNWPSDRLLPAPVIPTDDKTKTAGDAGK